MDMPESCNQIDAYSRTACTQEEIKRLQRHNKILNDPASVKLISN